MIDLLSEGRKTDIEVKLVLLLGLYQLLYLDRVPAHSAINESVELAARARKTSAKGFVNAILRKTAEGIPALTFQDDVEEISVNSSHPRWLLERWVSQFGFERARSISEANNVAPPLAFRLTVKGISELEARVEDRTEAVKALQQIAATKVRSSLVSNTGFVAERMTTELRKLSDQGSIYFQDVGSQIVANSVELKQVNWFWDVCAAPGGKTSLLAVRREAGKPYLVAGDVQSERVARLAETCKRHGVDAFVLQYDARSAPFSEAFFDAILVDAPCSGTGTIRHNPEIRYHLSPEDISRLARKQLEILESASKHTRPGGKLIYSTCSLEQEENEGVSERFLLRNRNFEIVRSGFPDRLVGTDGAMRTFPDRDGTDGFYAIRFVKSAAG